MRTITQFGIIGMAMMALTTGICHGLARSGCEWQLAERLRGRWRSPLRSHTQFTISIHSGPLGENPKGQMSFKIEDQDRVHVDVTCLVVSSTTRRSLPG